MNDLATAPRDEIDAHFLRRSFDIARRAMTHGNHPFGALLVDQGGDVLIEVENGYMPSHDGTAHAERLLATQACTTIPADILRSATLYSSAEPCAMCAGAMYWAGIGRLVYGLSEHRLRDLTVEQYGEVHGLAHRVAAAKQLLVTPIHPVGLVLGKLAPYLVIGIVEMALILTLMRFGFDVPINGSLLFLFATAVVYLFALLALGLTISMGAQTSMQAMQSSQMLLLPSIFLSGYIFPVAGLPRVLYWIGRALPATHMIDIMRGAVLRGAGPWEMLPSLLALAAISTVLVTISIRRVRKLTV